MTSRSELLEGALALARERIPVIPLRPQSKVPRHARWPDLGMLDEDAICQEWRFNPDSNVGVLCGPDAFDGHGLTILDIDQPDGPATLHGLQAQHGEQLPFGPLVNTPGGGWHHYFAGAVDSWNPGPGLEVRSLGRQCVAPPSVGAGGRRYLFQNSLGGELPELPRWLAPREPDAYARRVRVGRRVSAGLVDPVLEVPPPVYFERLCGLVPDRQGFVCCPLHREQEPSLKVYPTAEQGWFCYGESCRRGGDVVTLAAELAGVPTPVRGYQFVALLDYLRGRLL